MELKEDKYGPEYVLRVTDRRIGLEGYLVIHNTVLGPGKGGIRMTPGVSEEEVYRLASTMTWKNALAGIPFGGAKAGIKWPTAMGHEAWSMEQKAKNKKLLIQSFARALKPFLIKKYIAGPDVNTGEKEMRAFAEAAGKWETATGKPKDYCAGRKCGIPHEFGSTGFGVAEATRVAAEAASLDIRGATVAIHGFGNVGTFAYEHLTRMGAKVVLIADAEAAVHVPGGFDPKLTRKIIERKMKLGDYPAFAKASAGKPGGKRLKPEEFWRVPVDILIPASVTDVINEKNKDGIRAKLIVEAGNIPMRESIEEEFRKKGILIVPDFVANAGGVISSYAEYKGYSPEKMFRLVSRKVTAATRAVMTRALKEKRSPRAVAMDIARERVDAAEKKRKQTF